MVSASSLALGYKGTVVKNNKTRLFSKLYSDKPRVFHQSEGVPGPICIIDTYREYF